MTMRKLTAAAALAALFSLAGCWHGTWREEEPPPPPPRCVSCGTLHWEHVGCNHNTPGVQCRYHSPCDCDTMELLPKEMQAEYRLRKIAAEE